MKGANAKMALEEQTYSIKNPFVLELQFYSTYKNCCNSNSVI